MMEKIMIAGVGGQGIQSLGKFMASAALAEGKRVTWLPSYGAEMRGGASNCHVILSDKEIGSPAIDVADSLISMSQIGVDRFEDMLGEGGLSLIDQSLLSRVAERNDIKVVGLYATDIADQLGNARFANMVMLGAYLQLRPIIKVESILKELEKAFQSKDPKLVEVNEEAIRRGMESVAG